VMNRARQASITSEIMEIVGGAAALDGGDNMGGYVDMGDDFFGAQIDTPTTSAASAAATPAPDNGTATATIERSADVDDDEDLTPGDTKS
jgi:F-type H+-transporting ATPase subunit gamma